MPSLDLIYEVAIRKLDEQVEHGTSLDNKAGLVLGFAGLLVALAPDVAGIYLRAGLGAAGIAALAAIVAFWPGRWYPVLKLTRLRAYGVEEEAVTKLVVIDSIMEASVNLDVS